MLANRTLLKIITPAAFLFFYSFHHLSPNSPAPPILGLLSDFLFGFLFDFLFDFLFNFYLSPIESL